MTEQPLTEVFLQNGNGSLCQFTYGGVKYKFDGSDKDLTLTSLNEDGELVKHGTLVSFLKQTRIVLRKRNGECVVHPDYQQIFNEHNAHTTKAAQQAPQSRDYANVKTTHKNATAKPDGGKAKKKIEFAVQTTNELTETPVEWICEGLFGRKCLTEIFGDAGSGKSLLVQSMFQHQDCNGLNLPMKPDMRVLYILGKDFFGNAAKQRQADIGGKYALLHNIEEITVDMRNPLDADAFIAGAKEHRLDAIVFDTKRDFFSGESRADDVAATTMSSFRKIANELDCAVILISHGCKSHMNVSINSIVGSQVWGAKLDVAWYIQSGDGGIFQITNVKDRHNGSWRGKQIKFRMIPGSGVVATQEPFKVTAAESNASIIASQGGRPKIADIETGETILDALQTEFWTGDFVREATRKEYGMSERTAKSLLYELRDGGKVKPMHKQGLWIRATTSGTIENCATTYTHTEVFAQSENEAKSSILAEKEPF